MEDVLSNFREKWQKELHVPPQKTQNHANSTQEELDYENKVPEIFLP